MKSIALAFVVLNVSCHASFKAKEPYQPQGKAIVTATVKDSSHLPICNQSSQGVTGYVTPTDEFLKCLDGRWQSVKPGDTSTNFAARAPVRFHEWEDSIAKKRWSTPLAATIRSDRLDSAICRDGWKLPTREELLQASANGLFEGMRAKGGRAFDVAWTADFEQRNGISQRISIKIQDNFPSGGNQAEAGLYCVSLASKG